MVDQNAQEGPISKVDSCKCILQFHLEVFAFAFCFAAVAAAARTMAHHYADPLYDIDFCYNFRFIRIDRICFQR